MPLKSKSESGMRSTRSRSRSRSRGRSPARRKSKSPSRSKSSKAKQSPSPTRKSRSSPTRQIVKTPTTPTRSSTRIKELTEKHEEEVKKIEENLQKEQGDVKQVSTRQTKQKLEAKTESKYALGGPIVVFLATLVMPVFVVGLNILCNKKSCSLKFDKLPTIPRNLATYYNRDAVVLFLGYVAFQVLLACLPVGRVVKRKDGKTTRYNGFFGLFINILTLAGLIYFRFPVTMVYDKFVQLATTAICFSFLLATFAYIWSRNIKPSEKSEDGNTGCFSYDFYMGRAVNPQVGPINLKQFCERFTLTTTCMINAVFLWKAYSQNSMTPTLVLVGICQGLYFVDGLIFEEFFPQNFLTATRKHGFGFADAFAYIAMGPFTYCLQTRFLLEHTVQWHVGYLAGFLIMNVIGFIIYRGANSEKNHFRSDPHHPMFANFKKIPSPSGEKLLASGWWGLCRHPNYLGDLIMALAWTLPCGFKDAGLTWFYPVFLAQALLQRSYITSSLCEKKHGAAWERYCREVKYKLIPKVY